MRANSITRLILPFLAHEKDNWRKLSLIPNGHIHMRVWIWQSMIPQPFSFHWPLSDFKIGPGPYLIIPLLIWCISLTNNHNAITVQLEPQLAPAWSRKAPFLSLSPNPTWENTHNNLPVCDKQYLRQKWRIQGCLKNKLSLDALLGCQGKRVSSGPKTC